jgi:hypothetical protein
MLMIRHDELAYINKLALHYKLPGSILEFGLALTLCFPQISIT